MLILTRRVGESIIIGDNIKVTISGFSFKGGQVRLGIDAPENIIVDREEISEKRKANPNYVKQKQ